MNWPVSSPAGSRETDERAAADWVDRMPWVNGALLVGACLALAATFGEGAWHDRGVVWLVLLLCVLAAAMVVWFVRAFTFPVDEAGNRNVLKRYRQQIFIFAYAFTFISFLIVILPGPAAAPRTTATTGAGSNPAQTGAEPASAARAAAPISAVPKPMLPFTFFYGCFNYPTGTAIATIRLDCDEAVKEWMKAAPDKRSELRKEASYSLLLSVGGPAGRSFGDEPYYAVSGGLVLPFYVVLIAMIGGAISLSRRIPEIQKRADPNFPGTSTQSRLMLYEAREQVIFQIMQLVSAPFIAICSFHVIEPSSQTTTVALAFACGFASETILLMIRSVVEKIRPGTTATVANELASISGTVIDEGGAAVAGAQVRVAASGGSGSPGQAVSSDSDGRFVLHDVPKRKVTIEAEAGLLKGCLVVDASSTSLADVKIVVMPQPAEAPAPAAAPAPKAAPETAADDAAGGAGAPPATAAITGRVLDTAGHAVADAAVQTAGMPAAMASGADGTFSLTAAAGEVAVHALAADGVREGSATVSAVAGAEAAVEIVVS